MGTDHSPDHRYTHTLILNVLCLAKSITRPNSYTMETCPIYDFNSFDNYDKVKEDSNGDITMTLDAKKMINFLNHFKNKTLIGRGKDGAVYKMTIPDSTRPLGVR